MTLSGTEPHSLVRGSVFRYQSFAVDAERGVLSCYYELEGREFTERITLASGPRWHTEAARAASVCQRGPGANVTRSVNSRPSSSYRQLSTPRSASTANDW